MSRGVSVYAGAGDPIGGSLGNGMWKSTDAGKSWQHIGLEDTVKIDSILRIGETISHEKAYAAQRDYFRFARHPP